MSAGKQLSVAILVHCKSDADRNALAEEKYKELGHADNMDS